MQESIAQSTLVTASGRCQEVGPSCLCLVSLLGADPKARIKGAQIQSTSNHLPPEVLTDLVPVTLVSVPWEQKQGLPQRSESRKGGWAGFQRGREEGRLGRASTDGEVQVFTSQSHQLQED